MRSNHASHNKRKENAITDQQINELAAWTSIVINLIAFTVLFLKGRWTVIILSVAATVLSDVAIFGTYWHHLITEPLRWWPLIAIFRLAKPSSRWADWFYNEPKMQLARERYPTANPVPRSLRKQAIRDLRAIDRGDWSAIMKTLIFIIDLPFRFVFAFLGFTFRGWIGWAGIVLVLLRMIGVIHWPWWVAALPLEYGVLYCLYMTIDGALYRAGWKDIGGYARVTATDEQIAQAEVEQALRNVERENGR